MFRAGASKILRGVVLDNSCNVPIRGATHVHTILNTNRQKVARLKVLGIGEHEIKSVIIIRRSPRQGLRLLRGPNGRKLISARWDGSDGYGHIATRSRD